MQTVRVRGTEIGTDFQEAGEFLDIELVPQARIAFGRQQTRVNPMLGLIGDPIGMPVFLPVFSLQGLQSLGLEKINE